MCYNIGNNKLLIRYYEGRNSMKIISFMAIKGGVGKTTMAYQLAKYAQIKKKQVLLIDLDSQKSLTDSFTKNPNDFSSSKTMADLMNNPNIGLIQTNVEEGIDIIPSHNSLDLITDILVTKANKELLLFMWFVKNMAKLNELYDYVIIDLPPAWNLLTKNGVAVADLIISPMEPSRFGYDSHQKVLDSISAFKNEVTDPMTGKSYVVADLLFLGNRVKHNTSSSREFVEQINKFDDLLGIIQEKELINSAMLEKKSVFDVTDNKLDKNQREFIKALSVIFDSILKG